MARRILLLIIVGIILAACAKRPRSASILHEVEVTLQSTSPKPALLVLALDSNDLLCNHASRTVTFELEAQAQRSGVSEWKPWTFSFLHEDVPGIRLCIQQDRVRFLGSAYLRPDPLQKKVRVLCTLTSQTTRIVPRYGDPPPAERVEACMVEGPASASPAP
jgi:hypothetical protein